MPALRRARAPEKRKAPSTGHQSSLKKRKAQDAAPASSSDEDDSGVDDDTPDEGDDDFDDGEDLMAAARNGAASSDDGSDMDEDEDDSDDGGFEDLEANEEEENKGKATQTPAANGSATPSKAQQKRTGTGLYALPTAGEIQTLKESTEQYKNNVLRMQVQEMIPTVRPAYSKSAPLDTVLKRLKNRLDSLKPIEPQPLPAALKALAKAYPHTKVKVPFADPQPKPDAPHLFGFDKPTAMHLVGSWPLRTAVKRSEGFDVDVAVVMPSSLFQDKDYLNYRYAHKRAFYLAVLGAALQGADDLGSTVRFQFANGDARRPILVLQAQQDAPADINYHKLRASIRIHLAHEPTLFPYGRLAPSRNGVRVTTTAESSDEAAKQPPTPRYNASVLADGLFVAHLVFLHSVAKACPAFSDACALLKTWAFKRGYGSGVLRKVGKGGQRRQLHGTGDLRFVLTMVLAHLLRGEAMSSAGGSRASVRPRLLNSFNAFQLFRGTLDWLGHHDFANKPVRMRDAVDLNVFTRSDRIPFEDFRQVFDRVLVDPTGSINLLATLSAGTLDAIQAEARRSFALLDVEDREDIFDKLFINDLSAPVLSFDEVAHITLGSSTPADAATVADQGSTYLAAVASINDTVRKALTTRARRNAVILSADEPGLRPWSLDCKASHFSGALDLGIVLDGEHANRLVDHGPSPDDAEAAQAFRAFWGKLAELRRFKDGRIIESVVWEGQGPRGGIPRRIVRHVLHLHHGIQAARVAFLAEAFEGLLEPSSKLPRQAFHSVSAVGANRFQHVQAAFDGLAKQLRGLEGLPLSLVSVLPAAPALRGTSTFVPPALNIAGLGTSAVPDCASYLAAHDIILVFESSSRWPDDLEAIQAMKAAFFETLARLIPANLPGGYRTSVVFDEDASASNIQDQVALEIITPSGYAFRARIHCERERGLLEDIINEKRYYTPREQRQASAALARYTHRFVTAARHHTAMAAVTHRYPALAESVRLLKRWVSAQMLAYHVPEEALELLAVELFASAGGEAPSSGSAGFAALLRRLGTWAWRDEPLAVPLFSVAGAEEEMKVQRSGAGLALTETTTTTGSSAGAAAAARAAPILFPSDKLVLVRSAFAQTRRADPSLETAAWFVCTEEDVEGRAWSRGAGGAGAGMPFAGAAAGLQKLAAEASARLESGGGRFGGVDALSLFTPSLAHYDFVIHLRPAVLSRYAYWSQADPAIWQSSSNPNPNPNPDPNTNTAADADATPTSVLGPTPRPGFDTAQALVRQLTRLYGDTFRLFHDAQGGAPVVGGIWNPHLRGRGRARRFRVAIGFSARPVGVAVAAGRGGDDREQSGKDGGEVQSGTGAGAGAGEQDEGQVTLNVPAVLAEVERLGAGLIEGIEVVR